MPISSSVGTEKVPCGPARAEYELSLVLRAPALISGLSSGCSWSKSSGVSPGSGRVSGGGIGRGIGPIFLPALQRTQLSVNKLYFSCQLHFAKHL